MLSLFYDKSIWKTLLVDCPGADYLGSRNQNVFFVSLFDIPPATGVCAFRSSSVAVKANQKRLALCVLALREVDLEDIAGKSSA